MQRFQSAETGTQATVLPLVPSLLTKSIVIAGLLCRSLITVYVDGHVIPLKSVPAIMFTVNQLAVMQNTRQQLDRVALFAPLKPFELDNYVTLGR